jgi:glycosyltransferase involved in cell wall biosynthesis
MDPQTPKISVVIPVYNMAAFVEAAVRSVQADPWPSKEIIVVDDGSADGSGEVAGRCGDGVRVIRQQNQGAAKALNNGFAAATGDYFCWLSADDLFVTGKMSAQAATLLADPGAAATQTDAETIDAGGKHIAWSVSDDYRDRTSLYRFLLGNNINGSTLMIRRGVFEEMGGFDATHRADVDGAMWMKMMCHGHGIVRTPGVFGKYRWHAGNQSHDHSLMSTAMDATRLTVIENHWDLVKWWDDSDTRWEDTLVLALHMQHCGQSAKAAEQRASRPPSWSTRALIRGCNSARPICRKVARKLGRMRLQQRRSMALAAGRIA